jgi:hypothetical protein
MNFFGEVERLYLIYPLMGKNSFSRSKSWQKEAVVQKVAAEKDMEPEVAVVLRLFHQTMGLTQPDGPALPSTSQEVVETMRHQKANGERD